MPYSDRLVGVPEIGELLNVSRQRADQLTRTQGFPEPLRYVAPVDPESLQVIKDRKFPDMIRLVDAVDLFYSRRVILPKKPRLWRLSLVKRWAKQAGRL